MEPPLTRTVLVAADNPEKLAKFELVSLAGTGDPAAQQHLVALLRRRVRSISMAILGHPEDAEDAAQCVLLEILGSAPSFRGGSLNAWADRIAVRVAVRHARRRRVRAAAVPLEEAQQGSVCEDNANRMRQSVPRPVLEYLSELCWTTRLKRSPKPRRFLPTQSKIACCTRAGRCGRPCEGTWRRAPRKYGASHERLALPPVRGPHGSRGVG